METAYTHHEVPPEIRDLVTTAPRSRSHQVRVSVTLGSCLLGVAAALTAVLTHLHYLPWDVKYRTDFVLVALLVCLGPFGIFYLRDFKRIRAIDDRFPDFLRDMSESARGGMTLPRALSSAAKGQYGALTPEIRKMSQQVEWGLAFGDAMERFAERARSPLIRRTVNLVNEARHSGGNVVDILTAAADDAREIKQIVEQRQNQMQSYTMVVYVTFGVFLIVIGMIQIGLVPAFQGASEAAGEAVDVGGVTFRGDKGDALGEVFFHASLIQAITGGLIAGMLRRGNPVAGMRSIAFMVAFAWIVFRVLVPLVDFKAFIGA